jgi:hypothetical protein
MKPLELTAAQEAEMLRLQRFYRNEASRCRKARAFLAGCVMAGAELETTLLLMVNVYPDEAAATGKAPHRKGKLKSLTEWSLAELLKVAKAAGWLPSALEYGQDDWDRKRAEAGDYAEVVREMRNLAHPVRYMEDHYRQHVTKRHLEWVFDAIDAGNGWLFARIEKSLIEQMKTEGVTPKDRRQPKGRTRSATPPRRTTFAKERT